MTSQDGRKERRGHGSETQMTTSEVTTTEITFFCKKKTRDTNTIQGIKSKKKLKLFKL